MTTVQSQQTKKPSEENQTGWKISAKAPCIEDFEPSERAKTGEVLPRNVSDFAEFGVLLLKPEDNELPQAPQLERK